MSVSTQTIRSLVLTLTVIASPSLAQTIEGLAPNFLADRSSTIYECDGTFRL